MEARRSEANTVIGQVMPGRTHRIPLSVVFALGIMLGIMLAVVKDALIGDPRWWNLVMAGLLVAMLVVYLRRERRD